MNADLTDITLVIDRSGSMSATKAAGANVLRMRLAPAGGRQVNNSYSDQERDAAK